MRCRTWPSSPKQTRSSGHWHKKRKSGRMILPAPHRYSRQRAVPPAGIHRRQEKSAGDIHLIRNTNRQPENPAPQPKPLANHGPQKRFQVPFSGRFARERRRGLDERARQLPTAPPRKRPAGGPGRNNSATSSVVGVRLHSRAKRLPRTMDRRRANHASSVPRDRGRATTLTCCRLPGRPACAMASDSPNRRPATSSPPGLAARPMVAVHDA